MRPPSPAWQLVIELSKVVEQLLDANGRVLSLTEVNALRARLKDIDEGIQSLEECESP